MNYSRAWQLREEINRRTRERVTYRDGGGMHAQISLEDKYSVGELLLVNTPDRATRVNVNYLDSADN